MLAMPQKVLLGFAYKRLPKGENLKMSTNWHSNTMKSAILLSKMTPLLLLTRCNVAHILAEKLQRLGCKDVKIYAGGWEEWRRLKWCALDIFFFYDSSICLRNK